MKVRSCGAASSGSSFVFEYSNSKPAMRRPVPIARMQFYGTIGGGVYRETLDEASETNVGINLGGGVKVTLIGPLRLRFDYRVFTLQGAPRHEKPQRFYAGINLKF